MSEIKDGGPAFPARVSVNRDTNELQAHQFGNDDFCTTGLSLRDYFAAQALAGLAGRKFHKGDAGEGYAEWAASMAYEFADEMIKARES